MAALRSEVEFSFVRSHVQPTADTPPPPPLPPLLAAAHESRPPSRITNVRPQRAKSSELTHPDTSPAEPSHPATPTEVTAAPPPTANETTSTAAAAATLTEPADFTDVALVIGTGTATNTTNTPGTDTRSRARAAHGGGHIPTPQGTFEPGDGHSSSVALEHANWSCPWPAAADAEQINEQTVVIRVVVSATGKVESAELVSDSGHGFGPAAIACALRTRFTPARDFEGNAVRAQSPPIRVRFTR
jgi:protein TonB